MHVIKGLGFDISVAQKMFEMSLWHPSNLFQL